jgi:hypothetical protein
MKRHFYPLLLSSSSTLLVVTEQCLKFLVQDRQRQPEAAPTGNPHSTFLFPFYKVRGILVFSKLLVCISIH